MVTNRARKIRLPTAVTCMWERTARALGIFSVVSTISSCEYEAIPTDPAQRGIGKTWQQRGSHRVSRRKPAGTALGSAESFFAPLLGLEVPGDFGLVLDLAALTWNPHVGGAVKLLVRARFTT